MIKLRPWNKAGMVWLFCTLGLVATVLPLGCTSRMGVQARAAQFTKLSVTGRAWPGRRVAITKVARRAAVVCQRSNMKPAGVGLTRTKAESAAVWERRQSRCAP